MPIIKQEAPVVDEPIRGEYDQVLGAPHVGVWGVQNADPNYEAVGFAYALLDTFSVKSKGKTFSFYRGGTEQYRFEHNGTGYQCFRAGDDGVEPWPNPVHPVWRAHEKSIEEILSAYADALIELDKAVDEYNACETEAGKQVAHQRLLVAENAFTLANESKKWAQSMAESDLEHPMAIAWALSQFGPGVCVCKITSDIHGTHTRELSERQKARAIQVIHKARVAFRRHLQKG